MPGIKTTKTERPVVKSAKRAPIVREEPPVRWPSAATGSGAAYGVSHTPAPQGESAAEGCGEN